MKTESLIDTLSTGARPVQRYAIERRLLFAALVGLTVAAAIVLPLFRVRPDIVTAVQLPMFWVKELVVVAIAAVAVFAAARLSRPGARTGALPVVVAAPFVLLWTLAAWRLIGAAPNERVQLLLGRTWQTCIPEMVVFALPAFVATFWAMRGLAPTRLVLAGAVSGLMAGAIGATVYAVHCPEMELPFIATWYVAAIAVHALIGALLGPRLLRW